MKNAEGIVLLRNAVLSAFEPQHHTPVQTLEFTLVLIADVLLLFRFQISVHHNFRFWEIQKHLQGLGWF